MTLKDADLSGYVSGAPLHRGLIDGESIDKQIAESKTCDLCGGSMEYRPFVNRDETSYRAFAVCTGCGNAIEF